MPGQIELLQDVSLIAQPTKALVNGRVYIIQTEQQEVDTAEYIDIAIKGDLLESALTLISLRVSGQIEKCSLKVFEGGDITSGTAVADLNLNRVRLGRTPKHTSYTGSSLTPISGTLGTEITPAGGLVIIGQSGVGGNDKVDSTIDAGGLVCIPDTWYVLRITNEGTSKGDTQLTMTFIDPE